MGNAHSSNSRLDAAFAALADPTRRAILERLSLGSMTVSEIAAPFELSQPTISKHLKVLERAGLITSGRDAQRRPRSLVREPLDEAMKWLNGYRNPGTLRFSTRGNREIVMKREFAVPSALLFDAFTQPALLKKWFFGKPGGTLAVCEVARKPGDNFRYVWRDPDGSEMGMRGVCLELVRPKRIVATERYDIPWYPGEAVGTIALDARGSVTELTQTIRYETRAARDVAVQSQMEHAIALGYDRLEKLLVTKLAGRKRK